MSPRLLVVAPAAYLLGGVQVWLDYLVPGLQATGWRVDVALPQGSTFDVHQYLAAHPFERVHILRNRTGSRVGRRRAIEAVLAIAQPDLVLSVNIPDTVLAVSRTRKRERRVIHSAVAVHGLQAEIFHDIRALLPELDGMIGVNALVCALGVAEGGLSQARVHFAPCGVSIPRDPASRLPIGAFPELLLVSRLSHREKRVLDVPEILKVLDGRGVPYRLRVAGMGPDEQALRDALTSCKGQSEFLGPLSEDELSERVYRAGSILLVTSAAESGPLVAWEAMARRVAVVTSDFLGCGAQRILSHDRTCLIFPVGDCAAAADCIEALGENSRYSRITEEARNCVAHARSRERSIAAWDTALHRILTLPPREPGDLPSFPASGRLDRFFGQEGAETIRSYLGICFRHNSPGSEWPHALFPIPDEAAFLARARSLESELRGRPARFDESLDDD